MGMGIAQHPPAAVLLVVRGLVLGITRYEDLRDIGIPGGKGSPRDPSNAHTATRELYEETGVEAAPEDLVPVMLTPAGEGWIYAVASDDVVWPDVFISDPWEGYVGLFPPACFVQDTCKYADSARRLFRRVGIQVDD